MKIFYADDDEEDREIFCDAIRQINPSIEVILSKDGEQALEILRVQKRLPDFIFLDINMPRMNGLECMSRLKSDEHLKKIPVIIYSTTPDHTEAKQILLLGAEAFIQKQYSFERLIESLQAVLELRHAAIHASRQ